MAVYKMVLSTTENNNVGSIKMNQDDKESQIFKVDFVENNEPKNFDGLNVVMKSAMPSGYIVEQKVTDVDYANSSVTCTLNNSFLQDLGKISAWFSFERPDRKVIDSTKSFNFLVVPGTQENVPQGNYIQSLSDIQREIEEIIGNKDFTSFLLKTEELQLDKADRLPTEKGLKQLESRKAEITYVEDRLNALGTGTPIDTVASLAELNSKYPSGANGPVVALESDGKTGYVYLWDTSTKKWKKGALYQAQALADKSVKIVNLANETLQKTYAINAADKIRTSTLFDKNKSKNLFEKEAITDGMYVINGTLTPVFSGAGCVTDYMLVNDITTLYTDWAINTSAGAMYDAHLKYIKDIPAPAATGAHTFNTDGAFFVRFNWRSKKEDVSDRLVICDANIDNKKLLGSGRTGQIKGLEIEEESIISLLSPEILKGVHFHNYFDKNTIQKNKFLNSLGKIVDSPGLNVSDYIRVGEWHGQNVTYAEPGYYYDAHFNPLKMVVLTEKLGKQGKWFSEKPPKEAKFVRVNVRDAVLDKFIVNRTENEPQFLSTERKAKIEWLDSNGLASNKILFIGDSITWLDGNSSSTSGGIITGYQQQFRDSGAIVTTLAESGATYRKYKAENSNVEHGSIYDLIVEAKYNLSDFDKIVLFGGTNDVARGWHPGTLDSTDPLETVGALRLVLEYIYKNNHTADVYLFTPMQAKYSSIRPKSLMVEACETLINVANEHGTASYNMYQSGGINQVNQAELLYDGIHPNNLGMQKIGKLFIRVMTGC